MRQAQQKSKRSRWWMFIGVCLLAVLGYVIFIKSNEGSQTNGSSRSKSTSPNTVRLIATGDTIAHDALNAQALQRDGTYDYYQFMKPLQPYFDNADVKFCNQAVPGGGAQFGIKGYPVFNSPLEVVHDLHKIGCNVVNTGTNHTFDGGQEVIDAELNEWDKQPDMLAVAGANRSTAEQQSIRFFSVKGVRFAFLSYSTYSNTPPLNSYGLNMYDDAVAEAQISAARVRADIVLVSMRWGTEYSPDVNTQQEQISQRLASWGADVVLGHGPHVLEPVKTLDGKDGRKTLVWYSLGNFLNAQIPVEALVGGIAVMDVNIGTKKIEAPAFLPIYMHYEWTVEQKAQEDLLARKNFTMVPLDQASELLARSQNNTTVQDQTARLESLLNRYTSVKMLTSSTY